MGDTLPFAQLLHAVNDDARLDPYAFRLYCRYLRRVWGPGDEFFETDERTAAETNMSAPSVRRARKALKNLGYIRVRRTGRRVHVRLVALDDQFFKQAEFALGPLEVRPARRKKRTTTKREIVIPEITMPLAGAANDLTDHDLTDHSQPSRSDRSRKRDLSDHPIRSLEEERDMGAAMLWEKVKANLLIRVTTQNYDAYARNTFGISLDADAIVVEVANDLIADWLATRMKSVVALASVGILPADLRITYVPAARRATA